VPICVGLAALLVLTLREYRHPDHRPGTRNPQDSAKAAIATAG
jgi:hypothetical protein